MYGATFRVSLLPRYPALTGSLTITAFIIKGCQLVSSWLTPLGTQRAYAEIIGIGNTPRRSGLIVVDGNRMNVTRPP